MSSTVRRSRLRQLAWFTRRGWRIFYRPLVAFSLALLLTLGQGVAVFGAVITGQVQNYTPTVRQAVITLGADSGVGKYDRGQIELVSQDNPNARFIAANIVVLQVNPDSALVEVREKDGLQVEIGPGAHVLLDIGSGQARREEEALLAQQNQAQQGAIASQQQRLEQVRRQRQWEQAQADRAQQELQVAQARAREAEQQREFEIAQASRQQVEQRAQEIQEAQQQQDLQEEQEIREAIAQQRRVQQELEGAIVAQTERQQALEVAIAEAQQAQRELEIAQAEEARAQQALEEQQVAAASSATPQPNQPATQPAGPIAGAPAASEVRELWGQPDEASIAAGGPNADLPQDYLQAYRQARSQPTPENYYAFAQVLIDYNLPDKALLWLDEAETTFPATKPVNDAYEAIALADAGQPQQGLSLLETSGLDDPQLKDELRSYLLTSMGEWEQVVEISKTTPSAVTQNNLMIAEYCQHPPEIDRNTELPPMSCSVMGEEVAAEPSEEAVAKIQALDQEMGNRYPRDPYVLNTLGFLALQVEDYDGAYRHYKEMSRLLDRQTDSTPEMLEVKAGAINYLNNYNQNYDFLVSQSQDLALLRAEYGQAMRTSAVRGVGSMIAGVAGGASPPALVVGAIRAIDGIFRSRTRRRRVRTEQNTLLDQMRGTFQQDMGYVAARPSLEPGQMLQATGARPGLLSFFTGAKGSTHGA